MLLDLFRTHDDNLVYAWIVVHLPVNSVDLSAGRPICHAWLPELQGSAPVGSPGGREGQLCNWPLLYIVQCCSFPSTKTVKCSNFTQIFTIDIVDVNVSGPV